MTSLNGYATYLACHGHGYVLWHACVGVFCVCRYWPWADITLSWCGEGRYLQLHLLAMHFFTPPRRTLSRNQRLGSNGLFSADVIFLFGNGLCHKLPCFFLLIYEGVRWNWLSMFVIETNKMSWKFTWMKKQTGVHGLHGPWSGHNANVKNHEFLMFFLALKHQNRITAQAKQQYSLWSHTHANWNECVHISNLFSQIAQIPTSCVWTAETLKSISSPLQPVA